MTQVFSKIYTPGGLKYRSLYGLPTFTNLGAVEAKLQKESDTINLTNAQIDYIAGRLADAAQTSLAYTPMSETPETPADVLSRSEDEEWQIPGTRGVDGLVDAPAPLLLYRYLSLTDDQRAAIIARADAMLAEALAGGGMRPMGIAVRLGVERRTIERDLKLLKTAKARLGTREPCGF